MHNVDSSNNSYIFVCHAETSKEAIAPILRELLERGHRLFVDKPSAFIKFGLQEYVRSEQIFGIIGSWKEEINNAIRGCSVFLPILSDDHISDFYGSRNCAREVETCVDNNRPILSIHAGPEKLVTNTLRNNRQIWGTILDEQMIFVTPESCSFGAEMDFAHKGIQKLIDKHAAPQANRLPGAANTIKPSKVPRARVGWLQWVDLGATTNSVIIQPRPWPITLGAAVGLDRGRQVALCHKLDAKAVLSELSALETEISALGGQQQVFPRNWTRLDTPERRTRSANIVWQVSQKTSRDAVEGVIMRHFDAWVGSHGVSAVLLLPSENETEFTRFGGYLAQCFTAQDYSISVACFQPWDTDRFVSLLSDQQKASLEEVGLADRLFIPAEWPPTNASGGATTLTPLQRWINGTIDDADFFTEATIDDVRLAIIAGHLGNPTNNSIKPQEDRARALVCAARENPSLRIALSSLPMSQTLIHLLAAEAVTLRAVFGLISASEASESPLPWAFEPINEIRHGRSFLV